MDRPKVKVERRGLGNSFRMPRDAEGHLIRPGQACVKILLQGNVIVLKKTCAFELSQILR